MIWIMLRLNRCIASLEQGRLGQIILRSLFVESWEAINNRRRNLRIHLSSLAFDFRRETHEKRIWNFRRLLVSFNAVEVRPEARRPHCSANRFHPSYHTWHECSTHTQRLIGLEWISPRRSKLPVEVFSSACFSCVMRYRREINRKTGDGERAVLRERGERAAHRK